MKNLKITEGVWEINSQRNLVKCGQKWVADGKPEGFEKLTSEEIEANMNLICEAGNVYNETGLTPRELWEQMNDFKAALIEIRNYLDRTGSLIISRDTITHIINAALSKTTPKTEEA